MEFVQYSTTFPRRSTEYGIVVYYRSYLALELAVNFFFGCISIFPLGNNVYHMRIAHHLCLLSMLAFQGTYSAPFKWRCSLKYSDLKAVHAWSKTWLVAFNPAKSESLLFSRRKEEIITLHSLWMKSQPLKHHGVTFSSDEKWTSNITLFLKKSWQGIGILLSFFWIAHVLKGSTSPSFTHFSSTVTLFGTTAQMS